MGVKGGGVKGEMKKENMAKGVRLRES